MTDPARDLASPEAPWRRVLANAAEENMNQRLVTEVVAEFAENMKRNYGIDLTQGLPNYGLHKCLATAMIVARADALGIDPEALSFSRFEQLFALGQGTLAKIAAAATDGRQIPENERIDLGDTDV